MAKNYSNILKKIIFILNMERNVFLDFNSVGVMIFVWKS